MHLIILFLLLRSIYGCLNSTIIEDPNLLKGGRYTECNIECEQSKTLGYVCYEDISFSYDLWWIITFIGFMTGLFWSFFCLYAMIKTETKLKINPQFITIIVNIFVQLLRSIWLLCIVNGRSPMDMFGGIILESTLVKLGQCLMFTEFFTIILVWKGLVDSSSTMKKLSKKDDNRNYRNAIIFSLILLVAVFPLSLVGNTIIPILATISNFILLIFVIGLLVGGLLYSNKIKSLLSGNMKDSKKKNAIRSIMIVTRTFTILGFICFVIVILNTFGFLSEPLLKVWVWWFGIHTSEIILLNLLAFSVSQKARTALREKKTVANVYSETTKKDSTIS